MKISNIFRSVWYQMRHQPVMGIVTIFGTALSIFLIMIVVMMQEVRTAPYSPESNRDRFLHYPYLSSENFENSNMSQNGMMSYTTAKELLLSLKTPEDATAYQSFVETSSLSLPKGESVKADVRPVDDSFWNVFDFIFIDGKPFTSADFESGLPKIVITESIARKIFGTTEAAGREMLLNLAPFTVAGVVKDVSTLAESAYAQAWPNLSATSAMEGSWGTLHGYLSVTILAADHSDFPIIREEYEKAKARYEDQIKSDGWKIESKGRPYDQKKKAMAFSSMNEPDVESNDRQQFMVYLILLIVPAINLSSMTQSRLKQRTAEIGIRRSFGCTRSRIVADIIIENLVITIIAGVLGLIMSVVFGYLCNSLLFAQPFSYTLNPPMVDSSILLHWSTFGWALLFCFILNLLSSGLPAIHASRIKLVKALTGRNF